MTDTSAIPHGKLSIWLRGLLMILMAIAFHISGTLLALGPPSRCRWGSEPRVDPMQPRIPPPIVMVLAAALMWALHHWMPLGHWIAPPWNRLGGLAGAVGIAVAVAAFVRFRQARTTVNPMDPSKASRLVTDGVFCVSRNPMYLGLVLLLIGWAVWLGSASPWLIPPLFVIVITVVQIIPEEQALDQLFGDQYLSYRRSVARWIGRRYIRRQ